ncbi:MAG: MEDS domain-containing protein [Dehalococcoidia bacterium]|nr:MEDS domain-containing protein [Dehalococcoidia bacterium]
MRKTGIDVLGDVPWGTHLCHFYQTREDLLDILVPYFKAGLQNNELCMWITSEPLGEREARETMREAMPGFDGCLKARQIEIVPHTQWYLKGGPFDLKRVLDGWIDGVNQALAKGYDGLRVSGNTAWLEKDDWRSFTDYERAVSDAISEHHMISICSYSLDKCEPVELMDVLHNHQYALVRREGEWQLAENLERKRAEEALKEYLEHMEETIEERTKELREAQEELIHKEKLAALGELAGGVGHELRNPLGVISNAVYFLKSTLSDADQTTREYLELMSSEVGNVERIISDLLSYPHTRPAEKEEAAVSYLVTQVLEKQPPPEKVKVPTNIPSDLSPVFADPHQIGQVLLNLVTNAYQAMPEGGNLTISARAQQGQVAVSITDTGLGIPQENIAKIFEPLFTTKAKGIGLGLAVCRDLVEANGGSIQVESKAGKGSTFTVVLPTKETPS